MKRRYRILFFVALTPLVGLSWLASKMGSSLLGMFNIHLLGLIVAAVFAWFAMHRDIQRKWPAGVALAGGLPMAGELLRVMSILGDFIKIVGPSAALVVVGSLATVGTALVILVLPVPTPPAEPPVAPARVVE